MKLRVYVEVEASPTLAATMQRTGFHLAPDGTGMQVVIPNAATITKRKTKVRFVENPKDDLNALIALAQGASDNNNHHNDTQKR